MSGRLKIIQDTREQRPWIFPKEFVDQKRGTLKTADYALEGDAEFGIERKTLDDFLGTISSGWKRFQNEIGRMEEAHFVAKVIIVEASMKDIFYYTTEQGVIMPPVHNHPKLSCDFVAKRMAELTLMGVSILFCDRVDLAVGTAFSIFKQRQRQREAENKNA